ncbi:MAG: hypothetical protein JSS32_03435 [Verrucomicrobia bacterium]|nr:hypothetical protein [Verrucomicrobiota bacterium]
MPNPVNPSGPSQPSSPEQKGPAHAAHGGIKAEPFTFLGMHFDQEQAQKFWTILVQDMGRVINKQTKEGIRAIHNFGKSPGDPDYQDDA